MFRYFIFYKPFQVLCQFSKEGDKKTLADYFPSIPKDVYPVGRLDYDSEGLLLLTNDKQLTHQLLEPKYQHERTYWVQVEGTITQEAVSKLERGVIISVNGSQYKTLPARATLFSEVPLVVERDPPIRFRKTVPDSWLSLTLFEGKNRQVRKMTASVGFPTLRLIRYSIGSMTVEGLSPGGSAEIGTEETVRFFEKLS
jgi:23S rRNA pseudouridine2457 synthase